MSIWTDEPLQIGGLNLNTYAHGLEVIEESTSQAEGGDIRVAARPGETWRRKYRGARRVALTLWVTDKDADGNLASTAAGRRAQWRTNVDALQRVLMRTRTQHTISRTVRTASGLEVRTGLGSFDNVTDLSHDRDGLGYARFGADLVIPGIYLYAPTVSENGIALSTPTDIDNPGVDEARRITLTFDGPLTNPTLTNSTLGVSLTYTGTVASGQQLIVDCEARTALNNGSDVATDMSHAGDAAWFLLDTGTNSVTLTATAGTGSVDVDFDPPYL